MKRQWLLVIFLVITGYTLQAQSKKDSLPYLKYPTLPSFNLLMLDSSTIFNTYHIPEGKPTVLVFFSPDCDHCQLLIKGMLEQMDSMKEAQFYFFTFMSLGMLRPFDEQMHLKKYPNITVGKDYQYFFPSFYGAKYVPYIVIYDRKKKFVKLYEGTVKMPALIHLLQGL